MIEYTACPAFAEGSANAARILGETDAKIRDGTLKKQNLVWLELSGCSGNIISLLDGTNPGLPYMLTQMADLLFENSLMSAQGGQAMEKLFAAPEGFILAVEGAVATKADGMYTVIGTCRGEPVTALRAVREAGAKAAHVIAVGDCASFGGISAARPNPGDCISVEDALEKKVIKLTGCPCHPDWFLGTLAHLLLYGEPELDERGRPLLFYGSTIHTFCERRSFFDNGIFASKLGEPTCMFKLGCRGPVTRTDCPTRRWNGYVNWPVGNNCPCIGCAQFGFPDAMEPFVNFDTHR